MPTDLVDESKDTNLFDLRHVKKASQVESLHSGVLLDADPVLVGLNT